MSDEANIEDVAQSETTFEEEFKEFKGWLEAQVEELPPLPSEEEAEMGELCRVSSEEEGFDHPQYDSKSEEAIDWYRHYMSVPVETLMAEFCSVVVNDKLELTASMEMAVEDRMEAISEVGGFPSEGE